MYKTYAFRSFHKYSSLIGLIIAAVATLLNVLIGHPIALLLGIATVITFFQFRHYSNPYVELDHETVLIRMTLLRKLTVDLKQATRIERKKLQLNIHLQDGTKKAIVLFYLTKKDQDQLLRDITAVLDGGQPDLSDHLAE